LSVADAAEYALRTIPDYAPEVITEVVKQLEIDALARYEAEESPKAE
jgi:hypothetical protein